MQTQKKVVSFKFQFAKCGFNAKTISQSLTHRPTRALFERWVSADDSWVFVMVEGTSICWSISGRSSLFCQESKLWHKMHYLAPVCQPPCLCIWFSIIPVCLPAFLCVYVCLPAGDGQVDFEEFMTILGPKLLSSDNREGFLGNTIDNIFWQVRDKAGVCFSSLTVLLIFQFHPLPPPLTYSCSHP